MSNDPAVIFPPKTTSKPWAYLGISRSAFYRLLSADQAPKPLLLPGSRMVWRVADLDRWLARQPTGRKPRKSATTES
jgi:predicted DNA-binding transcriptional regulator AlpA